jgi:hypothetical protein
VNVTCDIGFSIQANVKSQYLVCTEQNTWNSTIEDCKRMYMYLFYNFACLLPQNTVSKSKNRKHKK